MNRRIFVFICLLPTVFLPAVLTAAQQSAKVPRIAFLAGGSRSGDSLLIETFWQRMKELGYIEGKNIAAEYRFAEGAPERLPNFAAELVRLNVDVIVAPGSGAVAAKKVTNTIPIVITYGDDPVGSGLVASLARPGGNVTGLSGFVSELGGKNLELLKEAFPSLSRVAVFWWNRVNPSGVNQDTLVLGEMKLAAGALQVTLQSLELRGIDDFEPAFSAIKKERADALIVLRNPFTATHRTRIVEFAAKSRLPAMYGDKEFVDAGGLMSYGVDVVNLWGRAATYVDRILKGAKPADLPVEQPTKFEFIINLKTAKQIGLTIPPNVLARADKVIR
ncbi:MAG TPA: ABC transporter substrate-binding protein [Candidatus Binatia bacterium]|jgi:putative ABC transport system substrate-binding protein|nr:ABC transporter substrate-binding protein [Candidatus Binatia bacterium]